MEAGRRPLEIRVHAELHAPVLLRCRRDDEVVLDALHPELSPIHEWDVREDLVLLGGRVPQEVRVDRLPAVLAGFVAALAGVVLRAPNTCDDMGHRGHTEQAPGGARTTLSPTAARTFIPIDEVEKRGHGGRGHVELVRRLRTGEENISTEPQRASKAGGGTISTGKAQAGAWRGGGERTAHEPRLG